MTKSKICGEREHTTVNFSFFFLTRTPRLAIWFLGSSTVLYKLDEKKKSRRSTNKIKLFFKWRFRFRRRCCCLSSLSASFGSTQTFENFWGHFPLVHIWAFFHQSVTFTAENNDMTFTHLWLIVSFFTVFRPGQKFKSRGQDFEKWLMMFQSSFHFDSLVHHSACTVQTRHRKRAVVISRPRLKCNKPLLWPKGTVYKDKTLCIERKQKPDFVGKLNSRYYIVNILPYVICNDIRRTRFNTPFTWFCHMKTAGANGRRYEEAEKEHGLSVWNTIIMIWFS